MHSKVMVSAKIFSDVDLSRPWTRSVPVRRPFVKCPPIHYPGHSAEALAELAGVHITTARRWKREGAPAMEDRFLRILTEGDLGEIDPVWRGWNLKRGVLCGLDGFFFTPGEVMGIPFTKALLKTLQQREAHERRFAVQADWIEGRYVEPAPSGDAPATTDSAPRQLSTATDATPLRAGHR
jgi:hypothetical protein